MTERRRKRRPLDYLFSGMALVGLTIMLSAGTVLGALVGLAALLVSNILAAFTRLGGRAGVPGGHTAGRRLSPYAA